jgi:Na+-translocating ferredoxin:NAD+ oxidoreductase RnfD subunit
MAFKVNQYFKQLFFINTDSITLQTMSKGKEIYGALP